MPPLVATRSGVLLRVLVQPRASRSELVGVHGDALRIRIAAPPSGGAANEALLRFLAERLGVPRSAVAIRSGAGSRTKVVEAAGLSAEDAGARLGL